MDQGDTFHSSSRAVSSATAESISCFEGCGERKCQTWSRSSSWDDFYMNIRRSAFQLRFPKGLDVCHGSAGASRWPRPVITDQERPQMSCMDTDHSEGRTPALFVVHVFVDSKPFVTSRLQFKTSQEEVIKHKRPKQARNKARCSANKESQKHT